MDDRYEILGKIGQGGIGAVYRGFDKNLSRDVAIKRILPDGGADLEKEATRQLTKEAGALSSLQHPHIVTIYDVGVDDDGPFVVMELLQGKTIDEVVEKASLTWTDFREFAMQTQEALIAAQDRNLVHRDLKPTNIMLTWLPSGKFQVKIVDFGLAKFSSAPSLQTIDHKDSIFGSIFFMSPEQFERVELDARTDMYSIGCVYYYALTGVHPFAGETAPQVMVSHLDHRVFPLHEIRADIPRWVCDWVMWHINRKPEHRPNNGRESLAILLESEKNQADANFSQAEPEASSITAEQILSNKNEDAAQDTSAITKLIKTAPQPILPPENFGRPSVHTASYGKIETAGELAPAPNAPAPAAVVQPTTTPTPLPEPEAPAPPALEQVLETVKAQAPTASKPRIAVPVTSRPPMPKASTAPANKQAVPQTHEGKAPHASSAKPESHAHVKKKPSLKPLILGLLLPLILASGAYFGWKYFNQKNAENNLGKLLSAVTDVSTSDLSVTQDDVKALLNAAISPTKEFDYKKVSNALTVASSKDGSNVSAIITDFILKENMSDSSRTALIKDVIVPRSADINRRDISTLPALLDFIKTKPKEELLSPSLEVAKNLTTDDNFSSFTEIINTTPTSKAETYLLSLIDASKNKPKLAEKLIVAIGATKSNEAKIIFCHALANTTSDKARDFFIAQFAQRDRVMRDQSTQALRGWKTDSAVSSLITLYSGSKNLGMRVRYLDLAMDILANSKNIGENKIADYWEIIVNKASNENEQIKIVEALTKIKSSWAQAFIEKIEKNPHSPKAAEAAQKALGK